MIFLKSEMAWLAAVMFQADNFFEFMKTHGHQMPEMQMLS
jgi:hypothetical protein